MKVKELIAQLKKCKPKATVLIWPCNSDSHLTPLWSIEEVQENNDLEGNGNSVLIFTTTKMKNIKK